MFRPVRARRLTLDEGQYLLRLVRRGRHDTVRYRRVLIILVSVSGTGVPAIARLVAADPDTVRDVIHAFNAQGLAMLAPRWGPGRPRRITDEDIQVIVATATARPKRLGLPFTHWSIRKLTAYLGGRYGHHDPGQVPARAVRIGRERVRVILHQHDISFHRTRTWKTSTDPDYDTKLDRIDEVMFRFPDRVFAFDQFGPLSIRPCHGTCWAARKHPDRPRATYHRAHGIRYFHGCYSLAEDRLWGVLHEHKSGAHTLAAFKTIPPATPTSWLPDAANAPASAANAANAGVVIPKPKSSDEPGDTPWPGRCVMVNALVRYLGPPFFVVWVWWGLGMPRRRDAHAGRVVYRTARVGLRVTARQRERCFGLLRSAGDVWACVLEVNSWRYQRADRPLAGYQELCRELSAAGPGTFGELDSVGARSVLRRYSDAWFAAAKRRTDGDASARFPRRRRRLLPVRWYHGTLTLSGRRVRVPTAAGAAPLWLRTDRRLPYPAEQVRSLTLLCQDGRLWLQVTAEVPVTCYPAGFEPDPARVAGVDPGIIHPYAVAGPDGQALLVSGRAIRAEHRMHLADTKARRRAVAARAPKPGKRGSRRWRKTRARARRVEATHRRRVRQAHHEATTSLITWAVTHQVGTLTVGDPRGVLNQPAGRRHNLRLRQWQIGRTIQVLKDKADLAGITVHLVNERGSSSTCPACQRRIPKPAGRTMTCPHCHTTGHRDLLAAATIATRTPGGGPAPGSNLPKVITHRRVGRHLPGAGRSRRDPRRRPSPAAPGSVGQPWPAPPPMGSRSTATQRRGSTTPPPTR